MIATFRYSLLTLLRTLKEKILPPLMKFKYFIIRMRITLNSINVNILKSDLIYKVKLSNNITYYKFIIFKLDPPAIVHLPRPIVPAVRRTAPPTRTPLGCVPTLRPVRSKWTLTQTFSLSQLLS